MNRIDLRYGDIHALLPETKVGYLSATSRNLRHEFAVERDDRQGTVQPSGYPQTSIFVKHDPVNGGIGELVECP
jgi:hypothetical protein